MGLKTTTKNQPAGFAGSAGMLAGWLLALARLVGGGGAGGGSGGGGGACDFGLRCWSWSTCSRWTVGLRGGKELRGAVCYSQLTLESVSLSHAHTHAHTPRFGL